MKFLKGLALSLLSFLLFLSLTVFGLALMLNNTILNPDFIATELDNLDVSSLTEEVLSEQVATGNFPEELGTAIVNTVTDLEPAVKEQVSAATHSIYDYLLGRKESLDLALTLKQTILSPDFFDSLVDELDISSLAEEYLTEQLTQDIPKEMEYLVDEYLDDAITAIEPWVKQQISAAADPVSDYLLGESRSLNVVISLEPVAEILEDTLKEAFLESPPEELAHLPQSTLEQSFDEHFGELAAVIPSAFELNESVFGTELPAQIAEALAEGEDALEQAKPIIGYLRLGFRLLIGFIVLLILGIIFIDRQVKTTTRILGIIFVICGVLQLAGTFIGKHFATTQIVPTDIPVQLQSWLPQLFSDSLSPLMIFSIVILVIGVALITVSFVYQSGES